MLTIQAYQESEEMSSLELSALLPAYIDPFSGTILLQVIIAGVIGCVAFFRKTIWRAASFVLRLKPSGGSSPESEQDGPND